MRLSDIERQDLLAETSSLARRGDFARIARLERERPRMTPDEYIIFVTTFNAFINHTPKPHTPFRGSHWVL